MDDKLLRDNVARDLVKTLRDARDLADIAATLGEVAIDDLLDDGLAKNIPIIKTARSALKAYASYRDYLLVKKLLTFLVSLESVPQDQRVSQLDQLACNEKERTRLGENLMLLLDRLDDITKPEMLANAWSAYLQKRINRDQLFDLHHAIDRVRMSDLPVLVDTYLGRTSVSGLQYFPPWKETSKMQTIAPPYGESSDEDRVTGAVWSRLIQLSTCGLFDSIHGRGGGIGGRAGGLRPNQLGRLFVDFVLRAS
jgi:hypothetical protein